MFKRVTLLLAVLFLFGSVWWRPDVQQIGAGVAIFLFGMLSMDEGFRAFTGGSLERLLAATTNRTWKSVSFGVVSTTIVQSSSLVTVITISFLSSGILELTKGIGIIFGANIGTTTGAWLVSAIGLNVNISAYAMPMLMAGVVLIMQKSRVLSGSGSILAGLGFIFLGIHFMKEGFEAFRAVIDLSEFAMTGLVGLLVFTALGMVATVIMQSSHATLVLIITALAAGQISYENAIALAIGANIGTTITAIIGALSANAAGKQLAGAHLIFNGVTATVALIFIGPLIATVDTLSGWFGFADDAYTLKLSLFHTLFNCLGVMLMLPFIDKLAAALKSWIPEERRQVLDLPAHQQDRRSQAVVPQFLSNNVMAHPDTALYAIIQETQRLWDNALAVIVYGLHLNRSDIANEVQLDFALAQTEITDSKTDVEELYRRYVRPLDAAIISASARLPKPLSKEQTETIFNIKVACRDLANAIKEVKHLQKNVLRISAGDNTIMNGEYLAIRKQLAQLIQKLEAILNYPNEEDALLAFSVEIKRVQELDIVTNGHLDDLIANEKITIEDIPSLMNDSQYVLDISHRLIQMAQTLYWSHSGWTDTSMQQLVLSAEELKPNETKVEQVATHDTH